MTIHVVETIRNKLVEIELRSEQKARPTHYQDKSDQTTLTVLIRREEASAVASNVQELRQAVKAVGVNLRALAELSPEDLARAVGYLQDQGRVIRNHPLFADLVNEQEERLPRTENRTLIWNTVDLQRGDPTIQERRWQLA